MPQEHRKAEFFRGIRDELPIQLGVFPFGVIFGVIAIRTQLSALAAGAMSMILFAGSAQLVAVQLFGAGTSLVVVLLVVLVVNLRHALYSASVAPHLKLLSSAWKYLLAYLLTDEAYAVVIAHLDREPGIPQKHWYFLGAGLTLWASWQTSTLVGILLGGQIAQGWQLGFALPLTFIAVVIPGLRDRATVAAAITAGLVAVLGYNLPYKVGLLLAALIGILVGMLVERSRRR